MREREGYLQAKLKKKKKKGRQMTHQSREEEKHRPVMIIVFPPMLIEKRKSKNKVRNEINVSAKRIEWWTDSMDRPLMNRQHRIKNKIGYFLCDFDSGNRGIRYNAGWLVDIKYSRHA
jgi:hypothetical protein